VILGIVVGVASHPFLIEKLREGVQKELEPKVKQRVGDGTKRKQRKETRKTERHDRETSRQSSHLSIGLPAKSPFSPSLS
jgi:rRNA processing protein Gar1